MNINDGWCFGDMEIWWDMSINGMCLWYGFKYHDTAVSWLVLGFDF